MVDLCMLNFVKRHPLLLVAYVLTIAAVVVGIIQVRERTLAEFGTAKAQADWDAWRAAAARQATSGPVTRRPPKRPEPPALVLMRDHFPTVLAAGVVFSSALFGVFAFLLRGVASGGTPGERAAEKRW